MINNRPMVTHKRQAWGVRLATLVLWLAVGASAVHWALAWSARPLAPLAAAAPEGLRADPAAMARLLGAAAPAAAVPAPAGASGRIRLLGVLAGTASGGGAALIAVEDQPPRPFRVGAEVAPGLVLQALSRRAAQLGAALDAPASLVLELPPVPGQAGGGSSGTQVQRP